MPTPDEELDGLDAHEETQGKIEDLPDWAQREIKKARNDAKSRRLELRKLQEDVDKREQARLVAEGNWKQLAEDAQAELARVKPYEERATALDSALRLGNEELISKLPEHVRKAVPVDYPPEKVRTWLDTIAPILTKPPAPDLNQGAGGSGVTQQTPQLNEDEKRIAKAFNMTDEDYAKNK